MTPEPSSADCTDYSLLDLNYVRRTTVRRTDYFYSVVITTVPLLQYRRHDTLSSRSSANHNVAHWVPRALPQTAAALPHNAALPHTAAPNAAYWRAHCHTLPLTLLHCRTAALPHTATHCHTLPRALSHTLPHCRTLLLALPHTAARTAALSHTAARITATGYAAPPNTTVLSHTAAHTVAHLNPFKHTK
jgi:hypothetical protein